MTSQGIVNDNAHLLTLLIWPEMIVYIDVIYFAGIDYHLCILMALISNENLDINTAFYYHSLFNYYR